MKKSTKKDAKTTIIVHIPEKETRAMVRRVIQEELLRAQLRLMRTARSSFA